MQRLLAALPLRTSCRFAFLELLSRRGTDEQLRRARWLVVAEVRSQAAFLRSSLRAREPIGAA